MEIDLTKHRMVIIGNKGIHLYFWSAYLYLLNYGEVTLSAMGSKTKILDGMIKEWELFGCKEVSRENVKIPDMDNKIVLQVKLKRTSWRKGK